MWLGFSLFGFYNLLERTIFRLWMFIKEKRRGKNDKGHGAVMRSTNTDSRRSEPATLSKNLSILNDNGIWNTSTINLNSDSVRSQTNTNDVANHGRMNFNNRRQHRNGIFPPDRRNDLPYGSNDTTNHVHWLNDHSDSRSSSPGHSTNLHAHLLNAPTNRHFDYQHTPQDYQEASQLRHNFYRHAQPPTPINWTPLIRRHRPN